MARKRRRKRRKRKGPRRLTRANTLKGAVPAKSGIYTIYDKNGRALYVGTSKNLRKRIQSYRQKDDFSVNRTKRGLRRRAAKFSFQTMPIAEARRREKRRKKSKKFNFR